MDEGMIATQDVQDVVERVRIRYQKRQFVTYMAYSDIAKKWYFGRTSGPASVDPLTLVENRFRYHHIKYLYAGFEEAALDQAIVGKTFAYAAIRGREQQLIDAGGGARTKFVANRIRGVSKFNPAGYAYWMASNIAFGQLYEFTGKVKIW
jgi:hypothetical protein